MFYDSSVIIVTILQSGTTIVRYVKLHKRAYLRSNG